MRNGQSRKEAGHTGSKTMATGTTLLLGSGAGGHALVAVPAFVAGAALTVVGEAHPEKQKAKEEESDEAVEAPAWAHVPSPP